MKTLRELLSQVQKVERIDFLGPCWEWQMYRDRAGYGRVCFRGASGLLVARLLYSLLIDSVDKGIFVCHSCDNHPCCNPSHLFAETPAGNLADAVTKRRLPRGEKSPQAKLTWNQVDEIVGECKAGIPQIVLARRFGVSQSVISDIATGKSWRSSERDLNPIAVHYQTWRPIGERNCRSGTRRSQQHQSGEQA